MQLQYQQIAQAIDTLSRRVELLMKQDQVPVTVEKKLSWWQTLLIWTGGIVWIVGIVGLAIWGDKKTGWLKLLWRVIKK